MIVEKVEELIALISAQRILSQPSWNQVRVATLYPWVLGVIGPPGPLPLPIIGNTHLLPPNKPWIYFEQLSKQYDSPLITFWTGRRPTIWICDAWAASELLDKRAAIYASRPRMVVFSELGAGQSNLVNMYYGDRWRLHRKLTHMGVGLQQVRNYRGFQNDESKVVALDLLQEPTQYVKHFERYATSVVSIIGFGRRVATFMDPIITEVIAVMQRAAELNVPGKTFPMLMESFPFLARFPNWMAPWKQGLGGGQGRGRPFFYALAEEAAQNPDADQCYAKKIFDEAPKHNLSRMEISSLSGNLFGAGSDTSSSTLVTFILACCAFPETLTKAWDELDRVVGPHRSPTFQDEPELPYVKAFMKEVLRWRSVAIIGGQPHAPIKDDRYKGWLIPKHTWVQGNVWAIHHHEREFPEPDRFNPDRYIQGSPDQRPFPNEKGYMTFGWGRRVCSGQGLAEQGTFITIARLLWGFRIEKALDFQGQEIPVDIFDFTATSWPASDPSSNGLNMRPNPFECRIAPRSPEIRTTIEKEGRLALQDLSSYEGETKYRMSTYYATETL
ncbi:cytochrome P450 monooxygenase [Penicillium macrosclerotiorum]|uniref:cytochrome P450 monooxygenase n=1 Tax=Penicillium macrosclerotiorum TaxID=303699 RepID=UPI0025485556|nr:cytochrome P450 monooxygenase [Penicillium macrosclerotiorum]KAJ5669507.1 cytochrome P450 monooxygenase [Penicillium macrosclerotiorum]